MMFYFVLAFSSFFFLNIKSSLSIDLTPSEIVQISLNKSLYRTPHFGFAHFTFHPNSTLDMVENKQRNYIHSYKQCALGCAKNFSCLSFNFGKQPIYFYHGKAQYLCELLPTDKYRSSFKYQSKNPGFDHYSIRTNCSNSPCLHGFPCIPNYDHDTYECSCLRPPFEGQHCRDIDECTTGKHDCSVNAICNNTIGSFNCVCKEGYCGNGKSCHKVTESRNCDEVLKYGCENSGVYTINPDGKGGFEVYCDQKTNGGGWTVFQKRQDGSVDFYRGWYDYKSGFGNLKGEFWLGLDKIYRLTHQTRNQLRVELQDHEGKSTYAEYDYFAVADEIYNYRLELGIYSGNAGYSLSLHRGKPFSTKDRDNDDYYSSCAVVYEGAWWFVSCQRSHLNGVYSQVGTVPFARGLKWFPWKNDNYSLKKTQMKFRPT